jgi:hypothetical protein
VLCLCFNYFLSLATRRLRCHYASLSLQRTTSYSLPSKVSLDRWFTDRHFNLFLLQEKVKENIGWILYYSILYYWGGTSFLTAKCLQSSNWSLCPLVFSTSHSTINCIDTQDPQNLFGAHGLTSTHVLLIESLNTCNLSEECFLLHYWCSSLYNGKSASRISLPKLRSSGENIDLSSYLPIHIMVHQHK